MENNLNEIKQMLDNLKYKASKFFLLNKDSFKYNYDETNIALNKENSYLIQKISMEKICKIIKKRINQSNKEVFDKLKCFLCNNKKSDTKKNFDLFDLKKEIFLDKFDTNRLKEEYYNKCNTINKKGINSNFRNKLSKGVLYKSKTHNILLDEYFFTNRNYNIKTNAINNIKIENKENETNNINQNNILNIKSSNIENFLNNNGNNKNKNKNNQIAKSTLIENRKNIFNISSIYTKRINLLKKNNNDNNNNDKLEENNNYFSSTFKENRDYNEDFLSFCKKNSTLNKFFKKSTNRTNNIFLSEDTDEYQAETYNADIDTNKYSSDSTKIISDRNIYKRNSFSYTQRTNNFNNKDKQNYNALNEYNDKEFKEIIINYNNKGQISFAGLKKNLKEEFNNSKKNRLSKFVKNKIHGNNKYITYNNIININDAHIIHKDVNLKKCENNPKIQTYLISFKSFKSCNKNNNSIAKNMSNNFFRDNIVYHRPKSSSKFRNTNRTKINLEFR